MREAFLAALARKADSLLITTEGMLRRGTVAKLLGVDSRCLIRTIGSNPDLDAIDAIRSETAALGLTHVVGMGGGSALDE